jgi:2-iminobutanoate/2-iminopropanoate deaminase
MLRRMFLFTALLMLTGCTLLQPPAEPIKREPISSPDAPPAIGPYSQAIKIGNQLYCSGQVGINPATGDMIVGDISEQTRQVLENLGAVLRAAGMDYKDVVKATVFLADIDDYKLMNEVYSEFFTENRPAREAVQVAKLPRDARVEISCIAVKVEEQ